MIKFETYYFFMKFLYNFLLLKKVTNFFRKRKQNENLCLRIV